MPQQTDSTSNRRGLDDRGVSQNAMDDPAGMDTTHQKAAAAAAAGTETVGQDLRWRDYGGRLSVANFNFNIPTNQGCTEHAELEHGVDSWRVWVLRFLHSSQVQILLMLLLFLDVIIMFVELLFLAMFPHCALVERDAISCCPKSILEEDAAAMSSATTENATADDHAAHRFLEEDPHGSGDHFCPISGSSANFDFTAGCDEHKWTTIHTVETVLFALTLTILSVFMIELTASMIALRPQIFFRQFFFLLDFVIVSVSLILEIYFHFYGDDLYQSAVGILVLIRIWRFIRIGHGIVELTNEVAHKEYESLLEYTEDMRDLLLLNEIPLPVGSEKFFTVEDECNENGKDTNLLSVMKREEREEHKKHLSLSAHASSIAAEKPAEQPNFSDEAAKGK